MYHRTQFDVNAEHLEAALDRFAQFFVAPLISAEGVDREINAVVRLCCVLCGMEAAWSGRGYTLFSSSWSNGTGRTFSFWLHLLLTKALVMCFFP
jgi:hypothetical protein